MKVMGGLWGEREIKKKRGKEKKEKGKEKKSQLQHPSRQQIKSFCQKGRKPLCSLMMFKTM